MHFRELLVGFMSFKTNALCSLILFSLLQHSLCIFPNVIFPQNTDWAPHFDWTALKPSQDLEYRSCYNGFECARLILPLDWRNKSNPNKVTLAVIRLPAAVPADDPRHGGSVILNPGGPGGPGTLYAALGARVFQRLLDGPKYHEIVSFDPRGVFFSTPSAFCFGTAAESEIWRREKRAVGRLDRSEDVLRYHWAAEQGRGRACAESPNGRFENGDNLRQYLSAAYVARDMLELVRKIEEHKTRNPRYMSLSTEQPLTDADTNLTMAKLQYIGVSYGTFLGQTFASMYPSHVGRMVLDGNIDGDNWVSRYAASVDDHEAIRQYFFQTCFAAKSQCPFWRTQDSKPKDIEERYASIMRDLEEQPVSVAIDGHATVITSDELNQGFFTALYQPLIYFKAFSKFLNDLYLGVQPTQPFWQNAALVPDGGVDEYSSHALHHDEICATIHCSDGPDFSSSSLTDFREYLHHLVHRFPNAGAIEADFKIPCWSWPKSLRTKWRFDGPLNGSVPILFVNNRLDPVTPLKNAQKMATRFEGSGLLVQDNVGHGALFPSAECLWKHVRKYMQHGAMPPEGSMCRFPCRPFDDACFGALATSALIIK